MTSTIAANNAIVFHLFMLIADALLAMCCWLVVGNG